MLNQQYEVIIVGAGASGIGAGLTLAKNSLSYIILEGRDRIGGRMYSEKIDEMEIDLGACWIHHYGVNHPFHEYIEKLNWKQKKLDAYIEELEIDGETGKYFDQNVQSVAEVEKQCFLEAVKKEANDCEGDISVLEAGKLYYQSNIQSLEPTIKRLVDLRINELEHYEASSIGQLSAKSLTLGEEQVCNFLPQYSYCRFLTTLASELNIRTNTTITHINYTADNIEVICEDGSIFFSKKVICTVPLGILKARKIKFTPELPPPHQKAISNLGFGLMNKIIISLQEPLWQKYQWICVGCTQVGKFSHFYNLTTKKKNILICFVTDNYARKIEEWTDEQIIADLLQMLNKMQGKQVRLKEYRITRWGKDNFALGSYSAFHVGSSPQTSSQLAKTIDNKLWIAGQHCDKHLGTGHGAFRSGQAAAREIKRRIKQGVDKS